MNEIEQISDVIAAELCRKITKDLPEYFGIATANEHYVNGVRSCINVAVKKGDEYVGLIALEFPYPNNCNIYWMGILRQFQANGLGSKLITTACRKALEHGATSMTVETLAFEHADANYLKTYKFYQKNQFLPLFNLKPQGYEWNMVYMARNLLPNFYGENND